jgi:protein gp37
MKLGGSCWWHTRYHWLFGCKPRPVSCDECFAAFDAATLHADSPLYTGLAKRFRNGRAAFNGQARTLPLGHPHWAHPHTYVLRIPALIALNLSSGDTFFEGHSDADISKGLSTMASNPHGHIGLLLTRYPQRMYKYILRLEAELPPEALVRWRRHLMLGFSAATQEEFNEHWAWVGPLAERGWSVFVSLAPLVEAITLPDNFLRFAEWVIVSGEITKKERCRPMDPEWARALLDQCRSAGIPFFMKAMAFNAPMPPDLALERKFPVVVKGASGLFEVRTHGAKLYVPSRGRSSATFVHGPTSTLTWIKATALARRTVYCVRSDEVAAYERALAGTGVQVMDCGLHENIGAARAIIAETARAAGEPKFLMVDDDLQLLIRKSPDAYPLRYAEPAEAEALIAQMEDLLDTYAQVGVSCREGNNWAGSGAALLLRECTRAMRMFAFRTEDFLSIDAGRLATLEDFDTTLQLLRSGRKNVVIYYYAQGQAGTQSAGGCSIYRNVANHDAVCRELQQLHSDFVTLRQKVSKTAQNGFGVRTEVTIQWQRAYASSAVMPLAR